MSKLVYKNIAYLFVIQFSNYVLPFLVVPILTRALGLEGYGKYAFYLGIANLFIVAIRFGFEFSATKAISINSNNKNFIGSLVASVLVIKLTLLFVSLTLLVIVLSIFKPDPQLVQLIAGGALLLAGQALLPIWYFQGMQQMKYVTMYNLVTKFVYVGALFAIIEAPSDYGLAVIVYGFAFFIAGSVSALHMYIQLRGHIVVSVQSIKEAFHEALPFFKSRLFVTAYTTSMVPIIGFVGDSAQVAIYSASEKLYLAAKSLMQPLTNALYPHVAKTKNTNFFLKVLTIAMSVVMLGAILGYFIAPKLIVLLFGSEFIESASIFHLHMLALLFSYPSLLLGYPLLAALGFTKEANDSVIWGCIVFFIIVILGFILNIQQTQYFVFGVIVAEAFVFAVRLKASIYNVFIPSKNVK